MEKIGGSIAFQLIDIFNIIEDANLSEEEKKERVLEYQKGLTQEGIGLFVGPKGENGQCKKNGFFVFGDVDLMSYQDLLKTKQYVDTYLSSFTCEAEMKMSSLIMGYDKNSHELMYRFNLADKVYNYAMSHGKAIRGHTLVWHNHEPQALDDYIEDHLPEELKSLPPEERKKSKDFKSTRKELTKSFLAEYMKTVRERYPDCYCWDVLNEIVPDMHTPWASEQEKTDGLRHSKWFEYLGDHFYIDVLEIARKNLPKGTQLYYNDYGEQNPEKRKAIIQIIENVKKYEQQTGQILLDGIGLQAHYDLTMTQKQIEEIFRDFAKTGKQMQITEIDISNGRDEFGKPIDWRRKRYD